MLVNIHQFLAHLYCMVQTNFFEHHIVCSFSKTFFKMAEQIVELFRACIITSAEPTCLNI